MIQEFNKLGNSNLLELKNIDKYITNEKHKMVLKFILLYKLTPFEIRMITISNIDLVKKTIKLSVNKSIPLANNEFFKELKNFIKIKNTTIYLFEGRVKDVPMTRLNVHRICENSVKKIASNLNLTITEPCSPLALRESKLNFYEKESNNLTPSRQEILDNINNLLLKKRNILIIGELGVGKSYLMKLINSKEKLFFIDSFCEFKTTLINWILSIHDNDKNLAHEKLIEFSETSKIKVLSNTTIPHLLKFICHLCKKGDYIIIIDSIDTLTPKTYKYLDILKENFCIVAAAEEIPSKKANLFWDFEEFHLSNLEKKESLDFIEKNLSPLELKNIDIKDIEAHIYQNSDGNPKKIMEFLKRLRNEKIVYASNLTEVVHSRGKTQKSIGFFVMLIIISLIPLKYLYYQTENSSHKIIGTLALVIFILFRFFRYIRK